MFTAALIQERLKIDAAQASQIEIIIKSTPGADITKESDFLGAARRVKDVLGIGKKPVKAELVTKKLNDGGELVIVRPKVLGFKVHERHEFGVLKKPENALKPATTKKRAESFLRRAKAGEIRWW